MTEDTDEPPELFRARPGDEIVEPLFGALRGEGARDGDLPENRADRVPRNGWRGVFWWRLRLLFRRGGRGEG